MERGRRKFRRYFPQGFADATYVDWERDYKWQAHLRWKKDLAPAVFRSLIEASDYREIAHRAVRIESGTNLLFSFEKMALRDAVKSDAGARRFAQGLDRLLHGQGSLEDRFAGWIEAVAALPRRQTRVLTWPLATVFGFIAQPRQHIFLKPNVTKRAAQRCGLAFAYQSRPSWTGYAGYLALAKRVRAELADWQPRDMIDIQSFLWVQGSDEYP
jgi:hypothetical protein